MYSVREELQKDLRKTLTKVKEIGYDYVEFAGLYNYDVKDIKAILDELGLEAVSMHRGYDQFLAEPEKNIEELKTLGITYNAIPWAAKDTILADGFIENLEKTAKLLKAAGIQLLYHNHDFEFDKKGDKFILDWIYESLPADLLQTEIDTCWVRYAGYDPAEYLRKYAGRAPIVHLKDFECSNFNMGPVYDLIDTKGGAASKPASREEAGFKFRPVGHGVQDIPAIIKAAEDAGAHTLIVEQDQWYDGDAFEFARMSREYLKTLGL